MLRGDSKTFYLLNLQTFGIAHCPLWTPVPWTEIYSDIFASVCHSLIFTLALFCNITTEKSNLVFIKEDPCVYVWNAEVAYWHCEHTIILPTYNTNSQGSHCSNNLPRKCVWTEVWKCILDNQIGSYGVRILTR